eukprot:3911741-Rhodomonas_salina.1
MGVRNSASSTASSLACLRTPRPPHGPEYVSSTAALHTAPNVWYTRRPPACVVHQTAPNLATAWHHVYMAPDICGVYYTAPDMCGPTRPQNAELWYNTRPHPM